MQRKISRRTIWPLSLSIIIRFVYVALGFPLASPIGRLTTGIVKREFDRMLPGTRQANAFA